MGEGGRYGGVFQALGAIGLIILLVVGVLAGVIASTVEGGRNNGRNIAIGGVGALLLILFLALMGPWRFCCLRG